MDPVQLANQVEHFHSKGFCVFDSLFASHDIDHLKNTAIDNFNEVQDIIKSNNLPFGVGLKEGYDEIVERQAGRFEVPFKMTDIFKEISESSELLEIIHAILGPEVVVANESLIISMPGTTDQAWHADGPHMSVTEHLPAHCLNVFIPMIDITPLEGPTEFRPASHYMTRDLKNLFLLAALKKELLPNQKPLLKKGSALLFDYRILHRGTANRTAYPRPVYVLTFGKKWYKDTLNYPHRSVFDKKSTPINKNDADDKQHNIASVIGKEKTVTSEGQEEEEVARQDKRNKT